MRDESSSPTTPDVVTDAGQPVPDSGDATGGESSSSSAGVTSPDVTASDGRPVLPATVAVVGDSLTLSAKTQIEEALTALGMEVVGFDAVESRRMVHEAVGIPPGVQAIDAILESASPDLWVIALGTNDVGVSASTEMFTADMDTLLAHLPASTPVMWVDTFIRQHKDAVEQANAAIRTAIDERPGSHVVDWYIHGEEPGIVTIDGVHLTRRGQARFAESISIVLTQSFMSRPRALWRSQREHRVGVWPIRPWSNLPLMLRCQEFRAPTSACIPRISTCSRTCCRTCAR